MLENVPQKHKKVNLVDDLAQISTKPDHREGRSR